MAFIIRWAIHSIQRPPCIQPTKNNSHGLFLICVKKITLLVPLRYSDAREERDWYSPHTWTWLLRESVRKPQVEPVKLAKRVNPLVVSSLTYATLSRIFVSTSSAQQQPEKKRTELQFDIRARAAMEWVGWLYTYAKHTLDFRWSRNQNTQMVDAGLFSTYTCATQTPLRK